MVPLRAATGDAHKSRTGDARWAADMGKAAQVEGVEGAEGRVGRGR
jgi:hypothetical protein